LTGVITTPIVALVNLIRTSKVGEGSAVSLEEPSASRPGGSQPPTEVLFPEAKRRERRRRLTVLAVIVVVLGGVGIGYAVSSRTTPPRRLPVQPSATKGQTVPTAIGGPLQHPYGLEVAPNGDLYIVDQGRDQILRRLPSGKFEVFAGNGERGFSGDGGPAVHAKLSLAYDSGIVVAKTGTVYFSDTGNGRVREVLPNGVIQAVAGGGPEAIAQTPVPALDASFGGSLSVLGLAIGPNGELYIGASAVYRLAPNGFLYWVIGKSSPPGKGVYSNPAVQDDFTNPVQLAFDGKGDLFVAGGGGFGLYEDTTTAKLRFIANVRGDGAAGAMAEASNGEILVANREQGVSWLRSDGSFVSVKIPGSHGSTSALDVALGKNRRLIGGYNIFVPGDGGAVGPNGAIYLDTNTGNTFTAVSALVEVEPNGSVETLWRS
jgi:hypothetical protein